MTKPTSAHAMGVTVDEVIRLARLHSSKDLRGIQTKLTSTVTELRNLANGSQRGGGLVANLGALLAPEECYQLLNAAKIVESVGHAVTHAKERRVRSEKETKRRQDARDALSKQLVARTFPLPTETPAELLETLKAALILNRARQFHMSYNPSEFNLYIRDDLKIPDRLYGISAEQHRVGNVRSLRYFMISDLTSHLAYDDGSSVEERLRLLQEKVAEAVALAVLTADERETLRLWEEALVPAANRQEGQA
ncbi:MULTISPECIES: hypothetical protein [unclassified Pseudomonas]|uniref:hypothetical protein n=1 Tax=unclassified Pseudomonas TaxID=196821 RepID=UPI000778CDD2|nr:MULTISPECIES: hypothetical protein [unclassified Pseudomonas]KYC14085.1 hypothetical protein WM94_28290 [Pseudomonas sp. ABFPK]